MSDPSPISADCEYTVWETKSINREVRLLAISVMFSALAVASSTALVFIPNLETLTLIFFLVGYRYGIRAGSGVAIISTILYEFIASAFWGPSGIIFFFKFPPYLLTACLGGIFGRKVNLDGKKQNQEENLKNGEPWSLLFAIVGVIVSFIYDFVTTISFLLWTPEFTIGTLIVQMMIGLPFTAMHCATNFVMFLFIPLINKNLDYVDPLAN